MHLDVYLLPTLTTAERLAGRTVVVIDILRATTTITKALEVGAHEVIPCGEIEEAKRIANQLVSSSSPISSIRRERSNDVVLGGERGGQRIEGFHFGNSPHEYTADSVGNKTLVFTTTNGTRAMQLCRQARRVLLASFNNLSALVDELRIEKDLALVCAGTDGHVTAEDVFFAGALVNALASAQSDGLSQNDEALLARRAWLGMDHTDSSSLLKSLRESRGGRNLLTLGMDEDIAAAAQMNILTTIAELDVSSWRIRRGKREKRH
jgi:2-phosphosulfolactate phosphatase